eukprot:16891-Heterococcus_DN1.PRE.2
MAHADAAAEKPVIQHERICIPREARAKGNQAKIRMTVLENVPSCNAILRFYSQHVHTAAAQQQAAKGS